MSDHFGTLCIKGLNFRSDDSQNKSRYEISFFQASLENSLSFAGLKTQAPKLKLRLTQDHFMSENFRNT